MAYWNGLRRTGFRPKQPMRMLTPAQRVLKAVTLDSDYKKSDFYILDRQRRSGLIERRPSGLYIAGKAWPANWMCEDDWQETVEDNLHACGWKFFHNEWPEASIAGLPDLVCWKRHGHKREIWRELKVRDVKGHSGHVYPHQWEFLTVIAEAGGDAGIWQWPDDNEEMLRELAA